MSEMVGIRIKSIDEIKQTMNISTNNAAHSIETHNSNGILEPKPTANFHCRATKIAANEASTIIVIESDSGNDAINHSPTPIRKKTKKKGSTKKSQKLKTPSTQKKAEKKVKPGRSRKNEPPASQTRIDNFFKCGTKIQQPLSSPKAASHKHDLPMVSETISNKRVRLSLRKAKEKQQQVVSIDLCVESDKEVQNRSYFEKLSDQTEDCDKNMQEVPANTSSSIDDSTTTTTSKSTEITINDPIDLLAIDDDEKLEANSTISSLFIEEMPIESDDLKSLTTKKYTCPPYRRIVGTTFAVDAFRYGKLRGITHYFLTHFHCDHYIGLSRKFCMPLYLSPMTARLVRTFMRVKEQYIHEMELNEPQMVADVEVTAIDANHCPGAVMFVFKLPNGKCILHTGDFRASADMESEPVFWNNDIHTIYLDTTYLFDTIYWDTTFLADKYCFHTQSESIDLAKDVVRKFQAKNAKKRILYVCGSYLVGKERFWQAMATEFEWTVWAHKDRRKALEAMQCEEIQKMLCDKPKNANFHILPWKLLHYKAMAAYFKSFSKQYDMLLAFRPSGLATKLKYRGKVNIASVQFLEHSSNNELKRFVMFLKPKEVISTVPDGKDPMVTPEIPQTWYKYESLSAMQRNFQPSITTFLKCNKRKGSRAPENSNVNSLVRKKLLRVGKADVVIDLECSPTKAKANFACNEKQEAYERMPFSDKKKSSVSVKSSCSSLLSCTNATLAGSEALSAAKVNEDFECYGSEVDFIDLVS